MSKMTDETEQEALVEGIAILHENEKKLKSLDESIKALKKDMAEMKTILLESLNKTPSSPKEEVVVKELKKEIVELKKENHALKQELAELWTKFKSFFEKHATAASEKWSSFFAKPKPSKAAQEIVENSNTFQA